MKLLIDCGNTRIKWCFLDGGKIGDPEGVYISDLDVSDLLARWSQMSFDQVFVSTVNLSPKLDGLVEGLTVKAGKWVKMLAHRDIDDFDFAYQDIERLGIDRCLVVLAVRALTDEGALIIDAGSAMTADIVLPGGEHIGGYIFPGCEMLQDSLIAGTSKIAMRQSVERGLGPGRSTEACVANAVNVMISQTMSFLEELWGKYAVKNIYLAGGDAVYVADYMAKVCEVRQGLVFEGMALVVEKMVRGECEL